MWLVTLVCLLFAIGLVWWSTPESGKSIRIHFPEGHGLQAEDSVRYRGIDVGVVESVELSRELDGVDVHVLLKPRAGNLAREGTRFWIVRPEFKLTGVTGLDTAVGNKYIALSPGDESAPVLGEFSGLAKEPADVMAGGGLELMLRGDRRFSVSPGSTVTYRGVEVGRVLDVGLSQDARFVDVRLKVFQQYQSLVNTGSRFWATSGVNFDFSFREGMKLNTESLDTIARGGVSFLTTGVGEPVRPGKVFTLYGEADESWGVAANEVRMTDVDLRGAVAMEANWKQKRLLMSTSRNAHFNGVGVVNSEGERRLLFPADVLQAQADAIDDTFSIRIGNLEMDLANLPIEQNSTIESDSDSSSATDAVATPSADAVSSPLINVVAPSKISTRWISNEQIRVSSEVENCLAVRAVDDAATWFHLPIPEDAIRATEQAGRWKVIDFGGDRDVWHGAPVLAAVDGKLIGILLVEERSTWIVSPSVE